jgi:hypothetical protein
MTASKHTPGPWELHSLTEGDPRMGDGSYCISGPIGDQRGILAKIVPPDWHETPATARLISATPDMFVALGHALTDINWLLVEGGFDCSIEDCTIDGVQDTIAEIKQAIAKAKGGE